MDTAINAKQVRADLPRIVRRVRQGASFTVLYRSRPAFRIVPVEATDTAALGPLADDPMYRAPALGASAGGDVAANHDRLLYG